MLEKSSDIGFNEIAELADRELKAQIAHRVLGAATEAVAIGAVEEIGLVDRPQEFRHGQLDELVFQCRNAQRPFLSIPVGIAASR